VEITQTNRPLNSTIIHYFILTSPDSRMVALKETNSPTFSSQIRVTYKTFLDILSTITCKIRLNIYSHKCLQHVLGLAVQGVNSAEWHNQETTNDVTLCGRQQWCRCTRISSIVEKFASQTDILRRMKDPLGDVNFLDVFLGRLITKAFVLFRMNDFYCNIFPAFLCCSQRRQTHTSHAKNVAT
jgi:hypothetical protein